jgi:cell division septum initiation protein DivIVA
MFQVVQGMPEQPYHCIHCGNNPADINGRQRRAIFSSGVDVDWGNSVYTCWECAELIADLIDREPRESWERVNTENQELRDEIDRLNDQLADAEGDLDKIREGAAARSRVLAKASSTNSKQE